MSSGASMPSRLRSTPANLLCWLVILSSASTMAQSAAPPVEAEKPRVIVLTDIGNEPDDSESMVRFLVYSNEFDVEGLLAVTSTWQRAVVHPELIEERVRAYGQVLANLKKHASGYPEMQTLLQLIRAGRPEYGMAGVGPGKDTEASKLIIAATDRPDPRPLWLTLWGGTTDLAQALWKVKSTRSADAVARFIGKLRVYSISDQDDAASWIRANFPTLFWIVSVHAFGDYRLATWTGISAPQPGADFSVVSPQWLESHIRKGPLGSLYPLPKYLMEGDTPSFLYLIPNGLGSPEHPDWGSWGGRYGKVGPALGLWSDSTDRAKGVDNLDYVGNQVSVWRWRSQFQNDFAARMEWTLTDDFAHANHPPRVVVNGIEGSLPVSITSCENSALTLSAAGTRDPDGNALMYHWWQYREATGGVNPQELMIDAADAKEAKVAIPTTLKPAPNVESPSETLYHVVLSVTDEGSPPLTRYRRVLVRVPTAGTSAARAFGCAAPGSHP